MTTFQTPIIAGVFLDEASAGHAVEALRKEGFVNEQIGVAQQGRGPTTHDLRGDLMNLGVPEQQASFYDREYRAGHIVVSVRPDGREAVAENILHNNGAYDYNSSGMVNPQAGQRPNTDQPGTPL